MLKNISLVMICMLLICCTACYDTRFQPRKRGYYEIKLPKKEYQQFSKADFPYTFNYPVYGNAVRDTAFFGEKPENPYWLNIDFPTVGGKVYLTYKSISNQQTFKQMVTDAYKLSYTHDKRALGITEPEFHTKNNVHGVIFEVAGNAASAFQFFATDSHKHFLRGALYFEATPNADSLAPANKFLIQDIQHLIQTLQWTK